MNDSYTIKWTSQGRKDFEFLAKKNQRLAKKVIILLKEMEVDPFKGKGKPEPLKHELSGCWSRRIDLANRLVYEVLDRTVYIMSARRHYEK